MEPTIHMGDRILANKLAYRTGELRRGDVAVFICPNKRHLKFIQRVAALPGDTAEMKGGELYINDQKLPRTRISPAGGPPQGTQETGEIYEEVNGGARYKTMLSPLGADEKSAALDFARTTVPNGHCFVLGDNRNVARDSRDFGPVPLADIVGRAEYVYLPRWAKLTSQDSDR